MLTELDRLVQLLESPIFTPLRMEVGRGYWTNTSKSCILEQLGVTFPKNKHTDKLSKNSQFGK